MADGVLRIDAVQQGLLSRAASRIAARFHDSRDQSVKLSLVTDVSLQDIAGHVRNLSSIFSVQSDGSVAAAPSAFFGATAGLSGRLSLIVGGEDASGNIYKGSADFYLSDYRVRVQLVVPPSNLGLPLANVRVLATMLNSPLHFTAQSDANGVVVLPDMPSGNLSLKAVTAATGLTYTGSGTAALSYNALVSLTLRSPSDVLANVPPISIQPLPASMSNAASVAKAPAAIRAPADPQRVARDQLLRRDRMFAKRKAQSARPWRPTHRRFRRCRCSL